MKRKKNQNKQRLQRVKLKINENKSSKMCLKIYSNEKTNLGFEVLDENGKQISSIYEIEGYYERDSGKDKILYTQHVNDGKYIDNIDFELTKYDVIIAIDTSYELFGNEMMAFTGVIIFNKLSSIKEKEYGYEQITHVIEWDASSTKTPENLMYAQSIENIRLHNLMMNQNPKIAVLIDSDLDKISSFNDRTKPIFENYYLPDEFHFFYASSDKKNDCLQNKLFAQCDNEAKTALKEYKDSYTG